MIEKRIASFLTLFLLLFVRTGAGAQEKQSAQEIISGSIVAHGGVVRADGNCRQTIIVRTTANGKDDQEADYIVVRHDSDCMKGIPEQTLNGRGQWRFSLIRNVECDELLDRLMYLRQMGPTGGVMKIELLWLLPGVDAEKIPTDRKLRCYFLTPAGFVPSSAPVRR